MKKIILFSLLLFPVALFSQGYFPFIEPEKVWADINIFDNGTSPIVIWTDGYKFEEDTVIGGKVYYRAFNSHKDPTMSNWMINDYYHYREEAGIVYKYDYGTTIEVILYNFNLVAGDSVLINDFYGYAHVSHIDSTLVCGSHRRTIHFANPPDVWVEGIGSLNATFLPLEYYYYLDGWFSLLCVNDSVCQLYQNPEYTECYIDTTYLVQKEEQLPVPSVQICPNPVSSVSNIEIKGIKETGSVSFRLFNSFGREVCHERGGDRFTISKSNFSPGIYCYFIASGDKVLGTGKIVVE